MSEYWVSCERATGYVETDENNLITVTCPIWRCFVGQSFDNLRDWLLKFGEVKVTDLNA